MTLGPWYVGDTPTTNLEVHIQRDGADIELDGYASATVLLYNAEGSQVTWEGTADINTADDVVIINPPDSSPFSTAGLYSLYLRLTAGSGGSETFFVEFVEVLQLGATPGWCTTARVRSITGLTVTDSDLSQAQGVIELFAGRTYAGSSANESIRAKDLGWLEKAVAYQAAWQSMQPGYLTRHAIKEVNQDGAQIIYAGSSEPNRVALVMLGPLARRALKNVSWLKSGSIKLKAPSYDRPEEVYGDYKRNDDHPGWRPL